MSIKRSTRRAFTAEFKAEAVALLNNSGKSIGQVAKDLGLCEATLRYWVDKAEAKDGGTPELSLDERSELGHLREENRVLRMERDFLKKAAAFFAKESK